MAYKGWVMMDKLDVAVRQRDERDNRYDFTGYIVPHGDKNALEKAKDWARIRNYDYEKKEYTETLEPIVHTFDNEGFTATILDSAGGSSQGGRLSFWRCRIEKDGVSFTIGVNDAVLADLIKHSNISNGVVKQKVMFARKGGQPGLIHPGMGSYEEATADMKHKSDMKSMKKTSKWEIGGIYSSITQTAICLGEVFDTMEEYEVKHDSGYRWHSYTRTELRKRKAPVKMTAWIRLSNYRHKDGTPDTFSKFLKEELDSDYVYFNTGKPPARAKTAQLSVSKKDMELVDKVFKNRYRDKENEQRYVRTIKAEKK